MLLNTSKIEHLRTEISESTSKKTIYQFVSNFVLYNYKFKIQIQQVDFETLLENFSDFTL